MKRGVGSIWIAAFGLWGCGEGADLTGSFDQGVKPRVLALSTYSASVGTLIEAYGTDFPDAAEGRVSLLFRGHFIAEGGAEAPVEVAAPVRRIDRSTLRWTSFGPYRNPLSPTGGQVGRFVGTVAARVVTADGAIIDQDEPRAIELEVTPSILVHEFQPLSATCAGGVLRALGGAAYRLRVETVGFEAAAITYNLSIPGSSAPSVSVRKVARGRFDQVGDRGDFRLPPVPDGIPSYAAIVNVQARDAEGRLRQTAFGITVHRPLEVYYNGNVQVAEVLAPAPVSGCIPGGLNGRDVSYTEAQSESRSRSYELAWNQSWLSSHTVSAGSESTVGLSETNGVGFATTDGQTFRWSLGTEVSGSFGLDKLVSMGMSVKSEVGQDRSRSVEESVSRETGVNASSTTTETEELSRAQGGQEGESFGWTVSSEQHISRGFGGHVIANSYGVFYRQTLRLARRAALVAYNQCGVAEIVGELDFTDWTWSPDLALGPGCPPLPESNLPAARCYLSPCGNE